MLNKMGHNTGILSFGKIRASWAQVGNDTDAYMLRDYYKIDYDIKGRNKSHCLSEVLKTSRYERLSPNTNSRPKTMMP